jgi:hypothetical protein
MRSIAVNVALVLVPIGWLLAVYGTLSMIGDYRPGTAQEVIIANQNRSYAALSVGIFCLASALWISGYNFRQTRVRALLVGAGVVVPLLIVLLGQFR